MLEHIYDIAVTVVAGALLAVGIGMINVGNRTRRLVTRMDQIDDRCHSHGLPYSNVSQRLTELEQLVEGRIRIGELALQEMRDGNANLIKRIDALEDVLVGSQSLAHQSRE